MRTALSPVPRILGDAAELREVFTNLILNAVDAMPEGGMLKISSSHQGSCVLVEVSDTGVGIPPENIAKIFEPFFTTKASGTGLGLSVAHDIIKDHNGTIDVQSTPEHGTRFILSFPVATAPPGESAPSGDEP